MQLVNLRDYEELARTRVEGPIWDFYQGGSEDEITLRENRSAFGGWWLRPRMLTGVEVVDLRTSVVGTPVSMPVLIAPSAGHGMIHPEGECATARAAGEAGTLMVLSTEASRNLEDVSQSAQGPLWFQLYYYNQRWAHALVKLAEAARYRAIVLTVDLPVMSKRERDKRNDFGAYQQANYPQAFDGNALLLTAKDLYKKEPYQGRKLTWEVLPWLRSITELPILVKGILTAEDALLALEYGAAGIVVSNHGGRQLDGVIPSIEALPEVVEAVAGRCEVYLDGGVRRGTDILKALALGARAVLIGRPILWGLAVNGQAGVRHVLELLREELELAMLLAGCPTVADIPPSLVRRSWGTKP
ncbi:MAG TPA: alpha-hydroxy acid oxidase [Ktedonobacteraceae bacterium]|nr:alpha-hydroxy acid oxidase [Ktedonobacteraceae bacterium]